MTDPNTQPDSTDSDTDAESARTSADASADTRFPPYRPGDLVYDRDADPTADEIGVMLVVATPDATAAEHTINALGRTVADVNAQYPDDDAVVSGVYISDLDSLIGPDRWRAWDPQGMPAELAAHCSTWGISVREYDFPATRLGVVAPVATMGHVIDASTETLQRSAALKFAADRRVAQDRAGSDSPAPDAGIPPMDPDDADSVLTRASDAEPPGDGDTPHRPHRTSPDADTEVGDDE